MVNRYMVRNIFILKNPDGFNMLYENAVSALFFMSIRIVLFSRVEPDTRLKRVSGTDKALLPSTSILRVIRVNICARIEYKFSLGS